MTPIIELTPIGVELNGSRGTRRTVRSGMMVSNSRSVSSSSVKNVAKYDPPSPAHGTER